MALSSINSTPQTGSFELLSTQLKNPPSLTNNSGSTVTVAITATGEWSLLNANFVTSDPNIIRYKKLVDGDGLTREKSDEKFKFKYPNLNPAILVGEIKDAKGNTKSTVSGKQQSFELQPGDSVSFTINDDPQWYGDNAGKLTISYTATTKTVKVSDILSTGTKIKLKSSKGDYLHRPAGQGVFTWSTGIGNEWTVEKIADGKIKLKSWKGDYLHRPDSDQRVKVTTLSTDVGNEWTVEEIADGKIKLKSWKGDYLHRPDSAQDGITTRSTGVGGEWIVEVIA